MPESKIIVISTGESATFYLLEIVSLTISNGIGDSGKDLQTSDSTVNLASGMVRNDYSLASNLKGLPRILDALNSLDDERTSI